MDFKRVLIERKQEFNTEANMLLKDFRDYLKLDSLTNVRVINVYDLFNVGEEEKELIKKEILFENPTDMVGGSLELNKKEKAFRVKFLEGQFNQREDSTNQLINFLIGDEEAYVSHTKIIVLENITEKEFKKVKKYYINPVEIKEIEIDIPVKKKIIKKDENVEIVENFINFSRTELLDFKDKYGIGMDIEDIEFCQQYFKEDEKRDPTILEIKLIDTYWSDHCRHTTFETEITNIEVEEGKYEKIFKSALENYINSREFVFGKTDRPLTLMDLGTINAREASKRGYLEDKEDTEEVNAASIEVDVDVDGKTEKWLLMFKNETHNHPTEIEPFGGASTCLGGAIRDPLSGRSYVYQAMRITGASDPREAFESTLSGKLPQRKITRTAKEGYSSYGYEIGAATGYVREIYDEGYKAKRMEVGALVAAAPKENVYRGRAEAGDVIVLVGGRTGRDGLGGAVGSSQKHTEDSLEDSGAEVQKGNPKIERKILRLFRRKEVSTMIKVCNDFGAGGVSVAIGELAEGVDINLDKVPLKYEGLNGMEIALSESQERMAVVIDRKNLQEFLKYSKEEDVEATLVAEVTEEKILKMTWRGDEIVSINRSFLETNGIRKKNDVRICQPSGESFFDKLPNEVKGESLKEDFINNMRDLNIGSQKGLVEGFDQTVGKSAVILPMGGEYKITPSEGMVSKLPVLDGETKTCSIMTYGFDPKITSWSTFHGGYYAVVESIARTVALGGDYRKIRFSFQEYFQRLGEDKDKWGKPFSALLGAYEVQKKLNLASIGGKDSMSGSFEDLHVPPTIISFAVSTESVENIISPEFKYEESEVGLVRLSMDENYLLNLDELEKSYARIKELINEGKIVSAATVKYGGVNRTIAEMSLGNKIGFEFKDIEDKNQLFKSLYGSIVVELKKGESGEGLFKGIPYIKLGNTKGENIVIANEEIELIEIMKAYQDPLKEVFPIAKEIKTEEIKVYDNKGLKSSKRKVENPKVLIPVITGTHGEYDMAKSFSLAGGEVEEYVIKTSDKEGLEKSLEEFILKISEAEIVAFPDGQILGGEPEADGKLYRLIFGKEKVKKALEDHVYKRDGLILGVGAGFQALIKSGLLEYGEVREIEEKSAFITSNKEAGFISEMVDVEVVSNLSPWFSEMDIGDIYTVPIGTKEGRVIGKNLENIIEKGQVGTRFINNLTGSFYGIESLTSPDGKILGTVSSIDRLGGDLYKNIKKKGSHKIFQSGINYFK